MAHASAKEQAHNLIERIDPEQVNMVVQLMEKLLDPVAYALAHAPMEQEEIGEEEAERAEQTRARGFVGPVVAHEEVLKEFGISPEEVERFCHQPSLSQETN